MENEEPVTWRENYSFQIIDSIWNNSYGSFENITTLRNRLIKQNRIIFKILQKLDY